MLTKICTAAAVLAATAGCGGGKGETSALSVEPGTLGFETAAAGTLPVQVKSSGKWTVSVGDNWCSTDVRSGSGSKTVNISVQANSETKPRSTTVTFSGSGKPATLTVTQAAKTVTPVTVAFAKGADISWVTEMEDAGYKFANAAGAQKECTALMKDLGFNSIRLRVWVNPSSKYNASADVVTKAKRAAALGMHVMIDFHYSDTWADPTHQTIPSAWSSHSYTQMLTDVTNHTKAVLDALKSAGVTPVWVQIGNEVSNGLLWNVGKADANPAQYAGLIDAGCKAAKSVFPNILTVVHLDNGFDQSLYNWNLGILKTNNVDYDLVGMSLYPMAAVEWGKTSTAEEAITKCMANIDYVKANFGRQTIITETGVKVGQVETGKSLMSSLLTQAKAKADCLGVMYWEPEAPSGYNGGYDMGAFTATAAKVCSPTAILDPIKN